MDNASLTVVSSGIKFSAHFTVEMQAYLEQSEKVLYLVNEAGVKEWIHRQNRNAESLDFLYTKPGLRRDNYDAMTLYILEAVRKSQHVCAVLYGHPTLFADPALNAVIQAKLEGYDTRVLPGVSATDCLFADLQIDTSHYGYQSFEATDFLIHRRLLSTTSHLILWEVGIIGQLHYPLKTDNTQGARVLVDYLSQQYPLDQELVLYEAAQYPGFLPRIERLTLQKLITARYSPITTLYIPPLNKAICDNDMLKALNIKIADLCQ